MSAPAKIRLICVDDHRMVREGLVELLAKQPDLEVVATGATGNDAIALYERLRPDIALLDLRMPDRSGLDAIRAIRSVHPDARIIVLTMYQGDEDIWRAMEAGAATYVTKDMVIEDLARVIRQVHVGERPMHADLKAILDRRAAQPVLTARETEVLALIAEGRRNKDIAATLSITEETVHQHLKNIFTKLKVNDRTAAVNVALRRGILHISSD